MKLKKLLLCLVYCLLLQGCFLGKWANKTDEIVAKVDVKIEDIKELYEVQKAMYIQKRYTYNNLKETIYGKDGNTEIWQYLIANEKQLTINLVFLDKEMRKLDRKLIELDKTLTVKYLTWLEYKKAVSKMANQMKKADIILEGLNLAIKTKLKLDVNAPRGFGK